MDGLWAPTECSRLQRSALRCAAVLESAGLDAPRPAAHWWRARRRRKEAGAPARRAALVAFGQRPTPEAISPRPERPADQQPSAQRRLRAGVRSLEAKESVPAAIPRAGLQHKTGAPAPARARGRAAQNSDGGRRQQNCVVVARLGARAHCELCAPVPQTVDGAAPRATAGLPA